MRRIALVVLLSLTLIATVLNPVGAAPAFTTQYVRIPAGGAELGAVVLTPQGPGPFPLLAMPGQLECSERGVRRPRGQARLGRVPGHLVDESRVLGLGR